MIHLCIKYDTWNKNMGNSYEYRLQLLVLLQKKLFELPIQI